MTTPLRVLIVEDSPDDAELMILRLTEEGFTPDWRRVDNEPDYLAALEAPPDLILADWSLPQFSGRRALQLLRERGLDIPFIIVSGYIGEEAAIEALRRGASDYVLKDRPSRLGMAVRHALEEKRLREERQQAEKEREKLQAQFLQAQKMEAIGRLAGGVAHDFNNMLGVILGHAEMALEKIEATDPLQSHLQAIFQAAERSVNLAQQLLAFARRQPISPRVLDLNETIGDMLKLLRRLIGEDIKLSWKPGVGLWPIKMDPAQIDQILANLVVNARDAIADVGNVTIETENVVLDEAYVRTHVGALPGEYVRLTVSDDGCGMDQATLDRIFEPFFTTKEEGKGTGLGLATVYGIVKQNHGYISVYSEPGQGTTFHLYLPRTTDRPAEAAEAVPPPPRGCETVLLVEDEEAVLMLSQDILERFGYTVLAARTPSEALALAEKHEGPIHLLLTDVVMPEMNGKELKGKLEALRPGFKCLFMSGYTANVIAHRGVLEENIHFLPKPFSARALAEKVRQVLDQ